MGAGAGATFQLPAAFCPLPAVEVDEEEERLLCGTR